MAQPDIARGTYVSILVENPDDSGTYVPLCGLTTRSFTHQMNGNDVFTRDCNDPEDVPIRRVIVTGEQWDLSGAGQYNRSQGALVTSLMGVTRNYRFLIGEPTDDPVYTSYWQGAAKLMNRQITGDDGAFISTNLTLQSDGTWTETEL